jgi:nitrite reductase/ring-hydroxylating ferredoxin subunit
MTSDTTPAPTGPARRTLLRGATALGVLGASGTLAACGGDGDETEEVTSEGSTSGGTASGGTTSGGTTSGESSGGSSGGGFAKTTDIEPGGGKIYPAQKVVVTQPTMGEYKAFSTKCTHEGCAVTEVTSKGINCPCHGSQFSLADGSVLKPPAAKPLAKVEITVSGTDISLA